MMTTIHSKLDTVQKEVEVFAPPNLVRQLLELTISQAVDLIAESQGTVKYYFDIYLYPRRC